jgi:hypothetical protein
MQYMSTSTAEAAETLSTVEPEATAAFAGEQPVSLAAALMGEPRQETATKEAPQSSEETRALPKDLAGLAETLGTKVEALYGVQIKMGDGHGETTTLGALKDLYAKQESLSTREIEIEERRANAESAITRAKQELEMLMSALPEKALKPEVMERVKAQALQLRETERRATMAAIPEWADESVRVEELKGIVALLQDYGFPAKYLETNLDHRLVRLVRDSYLRKSRIDKALAAVKKVPPTTPPKSTRAPAKGKAPSSHTRQTQLRYQLGEEF